ncbi:flavodoxin [Vibrio renipiscarius]|uniref:flavodoxin n=1 Tax=Vibrio renipiscarius TaxID=1461322 RepID=UPI003550F28E
MTIETLAIADIKNNWLYNHVDVEFPTKESLAGRKLYQEKIAGKQYQRITSEELNTAQDRFSSDDVFLVDFHRLTVMFSVLYSKLWESEAEQQLMVEFLTQIIYEEPCELYLGFEDGEAVATAIVTHDNDQVLFSDIATRDNASEMKASFAKALLQKKADMIANSDVYLEM